MRKAPGLADLVAGQAQISQCVVHQEKAGIHILPAGTVPPNPLELLSSKRFEDVVDEAQGSVRHRHLRFRAAAARVRFAGALAATPPR